MKLIKITKESNIPLIGSIMFGIIDRGSNLLQIRPTTVCNMNCQFCSTDAGPNSTSHKTNYKVDLNYLVEETKKVVEFKGETHINIDSVGEPTSYKNLSKLISEIKKIKGVIFISMQTNGTLLNKEKIKELEKAGLNRIHLSIHSTNSLLAKKLMGTENYNLTKIKGVIKEIKKSKIELLLAPVWIPKINDEEIEQLIKYAKELECKIGIQKYEIYKHSRKMKGSKKSSYYHFYESLKKLEKKYNIKLVYSAKDLEVKPAQTLPKTIEKNKKLSVIILGEGWYPKQKITAHNNRAITINDCNREIGDRVNIKIVENKNNIYVAKMV